MVNIYWFNTSGDPCWVLSGWGKCASKILYKIHRSWGWACVVVELGSLKKTRSIFLCFAPRNLLVACHDRWELKALNTQIRGALAEHYDAPLALIILLFLQTFLVTPPPHSARECSSIAMLQSSIAHIIMIFSHENFLSPLTFSLTRMLKVFFYVWANFSFYWYSTS